MKYTKEERLDIGRQMYDGKLSRYEAAEKYNINGQIIISSATKANKNRLHSNQGVKCKHTNKNTTRRLQ